MTTDKNAVLVDYFRAITAPRIAGAEVIEFSAWVEFGAAIVDEYGTRTRGVADRLAGSLYDMDDDDFIAPTMSRASFVSRVNEAVRLVAKYGTVAALAAAVEAFNDARDVDGKPAIYSVQRLAGILAPSGKASPKKAPAKVEMPRWVAPEFTSGQIRSILLKGGAPAAAVAAIMAMLTEGVELPAVAAAV